MFVFRKIWRALFLWDTRFEIHPFVLFPTNFGFENREVTKATKGDKIKHELRVTQWEFIFMVTSLDLWVQTFELWVEIYQSNLRVTNSIPKVKSSWNVAKFTGKQWRLFLNKVAGCRHATLLKRQLQLRCFPVIFINVFRKHFWATVTVSWYCF